MYGVLTAIISEAGIWDGARKESHAFLLSPSVYKITRIQQEGLVELGYALYDCLAGLSHIAVIAYDPTLIYRGAWIHIRKVFSSGVPSIYQHMQGMNIKHIPQLLKVDLMVDQAGNFRIAEIDGHNKHGLGYSTLAMRLRYACYPNAAALPGVVKTLAKEVTRSGHEAITLLYADQERFYVPEFDIAKQEFEKHNVVCRIISEMDADEAFLQQGLFLDLPFLYRRNELYDIIVPAYKSGSVEFIIPPKPFFGAKGILALLRNDGKDDHIEAILRTFIKDHSLNFVRQYIPETLLVGKQAESIDSIQTRVLHKRYVLKESISSGMKGTIFFDDEKFCPTLARACKTNMNWILQEEVVNQPQTFSWYEDNTGFPVLQTAQNWFMRVTAHYVRRQLVDMTVTARRDKAVHGAKDSLQIGTIIV